MLFTGIGRPRIRPKELRGLEARISFGLEHAQLLSLPMMQIVPDWPCSGLSLSMKEIVPELPVRLTCEKLHLFLWERVVIVCFLQHYLFYNITWSNSVNSCSHTVFIAPSVALSSFLTVSWSWTRFVHLASSRNMLICAVKLLVA